jgi:hypothetical protein
MHVIPSDSNHSRLLKSLASTTIFCPSNTNAFKHLRQGLLVYNPKKVTEQALRKHTVLADWELLPYPFGIWIIYLDYFNLVPFGQIFDDPIHTRLIRDMAELLPLRQGLLVYNPKKVTEQALRKHTVLADWELLPLFQPCTLWADF